MPLLSAAAGQLVAGFAVEVVRVAAEIPMVDVPAGSGGIAACSRSGRSLRRPTYAGVPATAFRAAAAALPLGGRVLDPAFDPSQLEDRIVLLGVTGLGMLDEKSTPLGPLPGSKSRPN